MLRHSGSERWLAVTLRHSGSGVTNVTNDERRSRRAIHQVALQVERRLYVDWMELRRPVTLGVNVQEHFKL